MKTNIKRFLALALAVFMVVGMMPMSVFAAETTSEPITGTITEDTVWNDGDVIGGVTIAGDVTITVNGTVTVAGTISMNTSSLNTVTIKGGTADAKLIRGNGFTGQMFYVEGNSYVFQNLNFKDLVLDGGAVWTGDVDATLNRGTTNEGVKATGSVLYLVRANAVLDNVTLQNHDDSVGSNSNAVFLREYASVAFNNSVARNNTSIDGYYKGGVVSTRYGATVTANNSEVYGNSATHGGFVGVGASGSYSVKVDCVNTKIHHNYASTAGGAFYLQDNGATAYQTLGDTSPAYLKLTGCTLEYNASPDGLIHSYQYYTPAWIEDTVIANNDCTIYTHGGENRSFSVAGNTQITTDHSSSLYETPVRIYGALDTTASVPMNEASVTALMSKYGYLVTATPDIDHQYNHTGKKQSSVVPYEYTSQTLHNVTLADLAQVKLYEGNGYTGWVLTDLDGNGMLDAVPVSVDPATATVTLTDTFKGANETQTQDASNVVKNVPVCYYEHTGYFFNGWLTEDGTLIKDASSAAFAGAMRNLTATWAVARPRISISASATSTEVGQSITLTATINNQNTEHLDYTYQWSRNGVIIEGATDTTYTVTEADAGYYSYQFKAVATDADYTSSSDYATNTTYGTANNVKNIVLQFTEVPAAVYVARIEETGEQYETLAEAVAAANELGTATITMLADVTLGEKLTVTGDVTIQGEHTLTRADDYTGTFFTVPAGAALTLDGGLVIDGGNNYAFDMDAYQADLADWSNPTATADSAKWFTLTEGEPVATAYMIVNNGTVNLNDVTIQNNYSVSSGVVTTGVNSTTNLTGATIKHVAASQGNGVVVKASGAGINVNINEGTVIDGNHVGGNHGLFMVYSGATLTMNGGEITDNTGWNSNGVAVGVYWATFNMNGGTICGNSSEYGPANGRNAAIYLHSGHTFNMTDGTICHNYGRARGGIDAPYSNGTASISGGTVVHNKQIAYDQRIDLLGTTSMVITGGTYTQDPAEWVPEGYGVAIEVKEEDGEEIIYYTVTDQIIRLERTGEIYCSIREAMKVAEDGDTLTVLCSHRIDNESVILDKDVTIDLGGKTIYGWGTIDPVFRVMADVTVTGEGKLDSRKFADAYGFILGASDGSVSGNLTIAGGTYLSDVTVASVTKGSLNVTGGQFAVTAWQQVVGTDEEGNDITEDNYNFLLNCIDANYKDGSATITVTGGTFYMFDPENNAAEGAGTDFVPETHYSNEDTENYWTVYAKPVVTVTFDDQTIFLGEELPEFTYTTNFTEVAEDGTMLVVEEPEVTVTGVGEYEITANAYVFMNDTYIVQVVSGTLTVKAPYVAMIEETGEYFTTLADAVAAANELDTATVVLLKDITLGEKITVTGDVTIKGEYTITRDDAYTGTFFTVPAGANLTLDGGLVIDGGNNWVLSEQYKTDLEEDAIGSAWADYVVPEEGAPVANAPMIVVNGSVVAKDVTIQNNLSTKGSNSGAYAVFQVNSGASLTTEGAKISHNATNGANTVAYVASGAVWTINDGTVISDNFAGRNGGVSRIDNGTVVMNGGLIEKNGSYNTNGTVFMFYGSNALFDLNGGTICGNSGVSGGDNGFNAPIYIHNGAKLEMSGGDICHNYGRTCGGIDAPYTNEADAPGNSSTVSITGGNIWYNSSARYGEHTNLLRFGERAVITGGWYSSDPSEWVPRGYAVIVHEGMGENGETLYEVRPAINISGYDKTTGEKFFIEFNASTFDILQYWEKMDTVNYDWILTLYGDVEVSETAVINEPLTMNLNGKTVFVSEELSGTPAFRVLSDVTVHGGTVDATDGTSTYAFIVGNSETAGNLTITDGTYKGVTSVVSVTKGQLNVSGGYFEATAYNGAHEFTLNCIDANYADGSAVISLTGGTYYGVDPENCAAEGQGTDFCAQNYTTIDNGDGTWTVINYVEWIKEQMLAGNDVTLKKDIVVDGSYIDSINAPTNGNGQYFNPGIFNVVGDVDVTFDLNGHNITYVGHADAEYTATKYASNYPDGIINSCTVAHGLFFANNGANLTIVDNAGNGTVDVNGMASGVYAASPNSVITVEGGTWTNKGCETCGGTNLFLYASHGGELYIKGGWFDQAIDANGDSYLIVEHGGTTKNEVIDYSLTKIEVSGGYFVGMDPEKAVFIDQGNGQAMSETNVVAEGLISVEVEENVWTVMTPVAAGYVCWNMQTGVYYMTVSAGLEEAVSGETVQLLKSTADNYVLVTPGTKLDLNGWTLTASYVVGFNTSAVLDSTNNAANGYAAQGLLVVEKDNIVLYEGNGAVPVYNPARGGYIFVDFLFNSNVKEKDGVSTINLLVTSRTLEVIDLLRDGANDNDIQIAVRLTWDNETGTAYQDFVFNEETIQNVMQSNDGTFNGFLRMFYVNVTGLEELEGVTATAMVIAGCNAVDAGKTLDVN
ncbi:MAG: hypothetical protein IJX04_08645 [Oscillospiraceae bacterium]|nr:hypothetical protein [Oscillospiraceae bacterium]